MELCKYLPLEYGPIRESACNIHKSQGTLPATQLHYHDFYQIYYLTKGSLRHCTEQEQVVLYSGDCFIIPPHFPHSIEKMGEQPEFYSFSFRRAFLPDSTASAPPISNLLSLLQPESIKLGVTLTGRELYGLEQLFAHALREFEGQRTGWMCALQGILTVILVTFARAYTKEHVQSPPQGEIQTCIRYIDHHFREEISVSDLLNRFHFSTSGFYRAFHSASGQNFSSYLTERRIAFACTLLRDGNLPLSQVAEMSGDWDYSSFYRSFRKRMGMSPAEYRRASRRKKT